MFLKTGGARAFFQTGGSFYWGIVLIIAFLKKGGGGHFFGAAPPPIGLYNYRYRESQILFFNGGGEGEPDIVGLISKIKTLGGEGGAQQKLSQVGLRVKFVNSFVIWRGFSGGGKIFNAGPTDLDFLVEPTLPRIFRLNFNPC